MSRSAYLAKLLEDARKGRKPSSDQESPQMQGVAQLASQGEQAASLDHSEAPYRGSPGGGAQRTMPPWEYAQGALSGVGLLKALLSKGLPIAAAKALVTRAGKPGAALTGESLSNMTKEEILKHFGEPAARVEAIMAAPEVNAGLKGADAVARNVKVAAARRAVRAEPELVTGVGGSAEAAPAPEFNAALVKAKEALHPQAGPKPSTIAPDEKTNVIPNWAPNHAPVAAPEAAAGKVYVNSRGATGAPAVRVSNALSPEETAAIEKYKKNVMFSDVNRLYREPGAVHPRKTEAQQVAGFLDSAVGKQSLPETTTLYRGVEHNPLNPESAKLTQQLLDAQPGTVLSDSGFMSTSRAKDVAERLSALNDPYKTKVPGFRHVVMEMEAPAGSKALPIENVSDAAAEHEVLLPRNTPFTVTHAEDRGSVRYLKGRISNASDLPGQAAHPQGLSPKDVFSKQKDVLNQYFESKGLPKYAKGGTVAPAEEPHDGSIYHCAADAVHNFAFGGLVPSEDDQHVARPEMPALRGQATGAPEQKISNVVVEPVKDVVAYDVGHPVTIDEDQGEPGQAKLDQAAQRESAKTDGPNALDEIERQRRQDLEDAKPGTGSTIARAISAGLMGFAGQKPIDFAARDKATRDEINAEAGRRKDAFLGQPGELAGRDAAVADSPVSTRLRKLVGQITGNPDLASGMSAGEVKNAGPFVQEYLQALRAGDAQRIQVAKLKLEAQHNAVTERQGDDRNETAARMADAAMLRAGKADKNHEDDVMSKYLQAQSSARNSPDYAQAQKDEYALDKLDKLLEKPDLDTDDIAKLKVELAKIASGGEGSQHIQDELGQPTVRGRAALLWRQLTGQPGSAGYKAIVEKSIKPYLRDIRGVVKNRKASHDSAALEKWAPLLTPDFVAAEKARINGETPHATAPGGDPGIQDAPFEGKQDDELKALGGFIEQ